MMSDVFTKRFVTCPECGEYEWSVEHLFDPKYLNTKHPRREAGPWYCNKCGLGISVTTLVGGPVEVEPAGGRKITRLVTLEIPPQKESIFLHVEGMRFVDAPGRETDDQDEHHRYYYEEHTCPTNYFRDVLEIIVGDDDDPHGLARFAKAVDAKYDEQHNLIPLETKDGDGNQGSQT